MSSPFLAEIRIFTFNFAPKGWAFCDGQILPLSQNTALFSLLGTTYGGNGTSNFALPNLQGCAPLHFGQGAGLSLYNLGETGGSTTVTLLNSEIPTHTHSAACNSSAGGQMTPGHNVWGTAKVGRQAENRYSSSAGTGPMMAPSALAAEGGGQPHNNLPPYLTLNFCIALQGVYPPRG